MSETNRPKERLVTHEGATAYHLTPEAQLRRSLMACLLWEATFYEDGESVAQRIADLVPQVEPDRVVQMAIEARERMKLRHAPLLVVREMARHKTHRHLVADTVARVIQRPDELSELLAIYAADRTDRKQLGKLSKGIQHGIARAFQKFNAYQLAKWNRQRAITLRDALFVAHPKPKDDEQAAIWKQLAEGTLPTPDTWEVALSTGEVKYEAWSRLLAENKLGALALLRNLRNMLEAGIPETMIANALATMKTERVLPFRFIAAARHAPQLEPAIEQAMLRCLDEQEVLGGRTALVVDHSDSMTQPLSDRSEMTRFDAAAALAVLLREICEECQVVVFSSSPRWSWVRYGANPGGVPLDAEEVHEATAIVPARRGFALRDAMAGAIWWKATMTQCGILRAAEAGYDRIIVITDEQSHQVISNPVAGAAAYVVNVSAERNGVGYGEWTHIDGWSESVIRYIQGIEAGGPQNLDPPVSSTASNAPAGAVAGSGTANLTPPAASTAAFRAPRRDDAPLE